MEFLLRRDSGGELYFRAVGMHWDIDHGCLNVEPSFSIEGIVSKIETKRPDLVRIN